MKHAEAIKVAVASVIAEKKNGSPLPECDLYDMKMKELENE